MSSLGKLWAGRVYGTNTGNLFIEFETTVGEIIGTFRFNDPQFGVVVYKITGVFNDSIRISGKSITAQEGVEYGQITAEARLTPDGSLRGTWHSTIGTGGTFEAFPHDINSPAASVLIKSDVPEQLYSKSIHLGSVRIFGENLKRLLDDLSAEFVGARPVVTYNNHGSQVSKYASDFIAEMPLLGKLDYIKVVVQKPEDHGINRVVDIEFNAFGSNDIRVQGIQESWVVGQAELLANRIRAHQNILATTFRKFGLSLNQLIFTAMLVAMPEITTWQGRTYFAAGVFALMQSWLWVHGRIVPNAVIQASESRPTLLARAWPSVLSFGIAVSASLVAALLFYWLTKHSP